MLADILIWLGYEIKALTAELSDEAVTRKWTNIFERINKNGAEIDANAIKRHFKFKCQRSFFGEHNRCITHEHSYFSPSAKTCDAVIHEAQ